MTTVIEQRINSIGDKHLRARLVTLYQQMLDAYAYDDHEIQQNINAITNATARPVAQKIGDWIRNKPLISRTTIAQSVNAIPDERLRRIFAALLTDYTVCAAKIEDPASGTITVPAATLYCSAWDVVVSGTVNVNGTWRMT